MKTKEMLQKILEKEDLSPAEQVEVLGMVRAEHVDEGCLDGLLKKDFLSTDQKIELL